MALSEEFSKNERPGVVTGGVTMVVGLGEVMYSEQGEIASEEDIPTDEESRLSWGI